VPGVAIDRKRVITSDEAIGLREVPKAIAIMGSGAVGVEFASIFRRFGSEVTILELLPRLVPVEDEAVSAELEKSFRKQGITCHTGAVTGATATGDGVVVDAQLADGASQRIHADYLPVATGRGPVTTGPVSEHRPADREGLHQGRRAVSDDGARNLGGRRRRDARHTGASATGSRVIGRKHHRG
jgi:dihydrolipoamide dehydrogenase